MAAALGLLAEALGHEIVLTYPNITPHISLQIVFIRPIKVVHPIYKKCSSDLQNVYIRPTKSVHPTYKKCASDLQKVCIRLTKVCASDLQICMKQDQRISIMVALSTTY